MCFYFSEIAGRTNMKFGTIDFHSGVSVIKGVGEVTNKDTFLKFSSRDGEKIFFG